MTGMESLIGMIIVGMIKMDRMKVVVWVTLWEPPAWVTMIVVLGDFVA